MSRAAVDAARPRSALLSLPVIVALLAVYFIWGSTYFAIRIGLESFPPLLMAGVRLAAAGAIMLLVLHWRGHTLPTLRQWRWALLFGVMLPGMGNGGVTFAEQYISSSAAALIIATMPLWATIWWTLRGRRAAPREWLGIALGLGGIVLLNLNHELSADGAGVLIVLLAALSWSYGMVWKREIKTAPGLMGAAAELLCAGLVLSLAGILRGERIVEAPTTEAVLALLYLTIFGALIAYSAFAYLLQTVRPTVASSYAYVNPIVAVFIGVGLGGETLGPLGLPAMALIVGGVALILLSRRS